MIFFPPPVRAEPSRGRLLHHIGIARLQKSYVESPMPRTSLFVCFLFATVSVTFASVSTSRHIFLASRYDVLTELLRLLPYFARFVSSLQHAQLLFKPLAASFARPFPMFVLLVVLASISHLAWHQATAHAFVCWMLDFLLCFCFEVCVVIFVFVFLLLLLLLFCLFYFFFCFFFLSLSLSLSLSLLLCD